MSRLIKLHPSMYKTIIAPSLLAGNHADLINSVQIVEQSDFTWIHVDIMDGHFVSNISFGSKTVSDIRKKSKLYFDTHLMIDDPLRHIFLFADSGSNSITIHIEVNSEVSVILKKIRELGCEAGIALKPNTPIESILPYINYIDVILIMTVEPGHGGQKFISSMVSKVDKCEKIRSGSGCRFRISVDGGINLKTAILCLRKGADVLITGTSFFKSENYKYFSNVLSKIQPGGSVK